MELKNPSADLARELLGSIYEDFDDVLTLETGQTQTGSTKTTLTHQEGIFELAVFDTGDDWFLKIESLGKFEPETYKNVVSLRHSEAEDFFALLAVVTRSDNENTDTTYWRL